MTARKCYDVRICCTKTDMTVKDALAKDRKYGIKMMLVTVLLLLLTKEKRKLEGTVT